MTLVEPGAAWACPTWCELPAGHCGDWPWRDELTRDPARVHVGRVVVVRPVLSSASVNVEIFGVDRLTAQGFERTGPLIALRSDEAEMTATEARTVAAALLAAADELERIAATRERSAAGGY